MLTQESFG